MSNFNLILASTSPFRKQLLDKLLIDFSTAKPQVDETSLNDETAEQLVSRLAFAKANAIASQNPSSIVIGSDQVAVVDGDILGKPHTHDKAIEQLRRLSGKTVTFLTGLSVQYLAEDKTETLVEPFEVSFRELTDQEIEAYLIAEEPYNCAGSFKSEALGICLFEKLSGKDPNTLIGLPLIELTRILTCFGFNPLLHSRA